MREPLECLEAQHLASRSSRRDANPSEDEIGNRQRTDCAEDHDRRAPIERHFVEVIPHPPGGLLEDPRPRIELVDVSLNPRQLSKEGLLVHHARVRIDDRALLLSLGRRGQSDEAGKRDRAEHET